MLKTERALIGQVSVQREVFRGRRGSQWHGGIRIAVYELEAHSYIYNLCVYSRVKMYAMIVTLCRYEMSEQGQLSLQVDSGEHSAPRQLYVRLYQFIKVNRLDRAAFPHVMWRSVRVLSCYNSRVTAIFSSSAFVQAAHPTL